MKERILIFGGSFDPIHCGHLEIASAAAEYGYQQVYFVPTGLPFKKPGGSSAGQRMEMCGLALDSYPNFHLCDYELRQSGPSYMVDTLTWFDACFPKAEKGLLMGDDCLLSFFGWYQAERIVKTAELVIAPRTETDAVLSAALRRLREMGGSCRILSCPRSNLSSSSVRAAVKAGKTITGAVPGKVEEYIRKTGLYLQDPVANRAVS